MAREARYYDSDRDPDQRDDYQRDRDRILYATEFRRLAGVTQVVVPEEGHVFHNRLTHSLKVAQVARRIAEMLIENHPDLVNQGGSPGSAVNPDVVEAAALAHDLGHPPFGHAAETELDKLTRKAGAEGFEGNPQSFRILTSLCVRHSEFAGLNLTAATLMASTKYPWMRAPDKDHPIHYRKWGAYDSEAEVLAWCQEQTEQTEEAKCVEAQIMDWADDIAYAVHDVEDFYRAGLLPLDRITIDDDEAARFFSKALARRKREEITTPSEAALESALENFLVALPITRPYENDFLVRSALQTTTAQLIDRFVQNTTLEANSDGLPTLVQDTSTAEEVAILKELTWIYVIESPALASQQAGVKFIIRRLFAALMEAAKKLSNRAMFPAFYLALLREADVLADGDKEERKRLHARIVADFIASMTDQQAVQMANKIRGVSLGSVVDLWPE